MDIVPWLIENHTNALSSVELSFGVMDLSDTKAAFPRGFDLILSRDAPQHNPLSKVVPALQHYTLSDAKYLLVGSYPENINTKRVRHAGYYWMEINLAAPPFCLRPLRASGGDRRGGPKKVDTCCSTLQVDLHLQDCRSPDGRLCSTGERGGATRA